MSTDYAYDDEADMDEDDYPDAPDQAPDDHDDYVAEPTPEDLDDSDDFDRLTGSPPEEPEEVPLLELEEIEQAYDKVGGTLWAMGPDGRTLAAGVVQLLAQMRWAQAQLEVLRAVVRHEYTVTDGTDPGADAELVPAEKADMVISRDRTRIVWRRSAYTLPWERHSADEYSDEPPF